MPKIDLNKILHGEDKLEIFKPMKPDGSKYICYQKFIDFQDKGKLTIIVGEKSFVNSETKELHAKITSFLVVRDMGGFGFKGSVKPLISETRPKRNPDFVVEEPFPPHVAIL